MKDFTQVIKDTMNVYGHDICVLADSLGITEKDMNNILEGTLCPGPEFVDQFISVYHFEEKETKDFRKAWRSARLEFANRLNKVERQLNATLFLRSMRVCETTPLENRLVYVIAASQYYHNTLVSIEAAPAIVQEIINMRNTIVYNIGSDDYNNVMYRLMDDDVWKEITDTVRKVCTPS